MKADELQVSEPTIKSYRSDNDGLDCTGTINSDQRLYKAKSLVER